MNRKAQGLPLNVIIIAVILLVVLVVLIVIFTGRTGKFAKQADSCSVKGGECSGVPCGENSKFNDWVTTDIDLGQENCQHCCIKLYEK